MTRTGERRPAVHVRAAMGRCGGAIIGVIVLVCAVGVGIYLVMSERSRQERQGLRGQSQAAAAPTRVWRSEKDGLEYVWIPPGTFQMGCVPGDRLQCGSDESPRHAVTLTKGFWLSKAETTVGSYQRYAAATGRGMPSAPLLNAGWSESEHPMVTVAWNDARGFCEWGGGRLPTEAEWEYAARGGLEGKRYPWGDDVPVCRDGASSGARFDDDGACDSEKGSRTTRVGSYAANRYGLCDMSGNVWEWVSDLYGSYPGGAVSSSSGRWRVARGGSWRDGSGRLRVSTRNWLPSLGWDSVGFRCARDVSP